MRGIDISHHNGWPFDTETAKAYEGSDFVIIKATQGVSYKYVGYFAPAVQKALADGKLVGAYHYAGGNDAIQEADYFVSVITPYLGKVVVALDWEQGQNKAWNKDKNWCKRFVDRVRLKTGLTCFVYTGMDGIPYCQNLANKVPLWFAGYPKDENSWAIPRWPSYYSVSPWTHYTIWQFTCGGNKIDRDITNLKPSDWRKYAGNDTNASDEVTPAGKTLDLVYDTILGKYGNGEARKQMLGTRYYEVQNFINHIVKSDVLTLAEETLSGKFGNGDTRKIVLGDRYTAVQKKVNEILNG